MSDDLILSCKEWDKRQRKAFGKQTSKSQVGVIHRSSILRNARQVRILEKMYLLQDIIETLAKFKIDKVFMGKAGIEAIQEVDQMIIELNREQLGVSLFFYDKVGLML